MDTRNLAGCGLLLLALSVPARAQPPVEVEGVAELVCSPAGPADQLAAQCPRLPAPQLPLAQTAASPRGFDINHAVPARDDERGAGYYVFGETRDGHDGPYLAFAPAGSLNLPEAWEFFTGRGLAGTSNWVSYRPWQAHTDDQGRWSPGRRATVFGRDEKPDGCNGFQGGWNAGLKRWLMFYACQGESRVRLAPESWGPWSQAMVVGGGDGTSRLLASADAAAAEGVAERKTELYWLSQTGPSSLKVYRSTLRQPVGN